MASKQYFSTKPKLLAILQMAGASGQLFTADQVVGLLGKYIESNKLYDPLNKRIIHCKNDLLGEVFQVDQFTVTDFKNLWKFIFPCLFPATKKEMSSNELQQNQTCNELHGCSQTGESSSSELPWWYYVSGKTRHGEADDETEGGSYTGRETIDIHDVDSEFEESVDACDGDEIFQGEYEPVDESDSDTDSDDTIPVTSDEEENMPNIASLQKFQTDSDDDTSTTDLSMDSDILLEEHWACIECGTMNMPTVGYCMRCWKLRKGWVKAHDIQRSFTEPSKPTNHPLPIHRGFSLDVADGRTRTPDGHTSEASCSSQSTIVPTIPSFASPLKHKLEDAPETSLASEGSEPKKMHLDDTLPTQSMESVMSSSSQATTSSSENNSFPGLCNICRNNPNDAVIIHRNISHQFCCFRCAKRLKKKGKTCPVCRQPIMLVIRNFIVQF
ncbi:unnamed protein product [Clavelina lepadiformis]|uniref:P53-binding protein Mdm2 n=1 Tax=Clavelina lepadiformis TaxID=159417 RepID=A0ABP0GVX8_CLALP